MGVTLAPPEQATTLEVAEGLLAAISDSPGVSTPERCYAHLGEVAWDGCDQLVISVTGYRPGTPANPALPLISCGPAVVVAQVSRVWCVPVGTGKRPPTAEELSEAGAGSIQEADALWRATSAAISEADCSGRVLAARALGPGGGLVGWVIDIEWTLTGGLNG